MTLRRFRSCARLLVVLTLAAVAGSTFAPLVASAAPPNLTARAWSAVVGRGQPVFLVGQVTPVRAGTVQLQRLSRNRWQTVDSGQLADGGTYALTDNAPVGFDAFRAVLNGRVISNVVLVQVEREKAPAAGNRLKALGDSGILPESGVPHLVPGLVGVGQVATGGDFSDATALMIDGTVRAWGGTECGAESQTFGRTNQPQRVAGLSAVVMVASTFSCGGIALRADGTVWAWGDAPRRQPQPDRASQVAGLRGIVAVAGGALTGYALTRDGTVEAWGEGIEGELGNGIRDNSLTPVRVSGLTHVRSIAASPGGSTAYALMADRTVRSWGENDEGQLGIGVLGGVRRLPATVHGLHDVVALAAGDFDGYALTGDGVVRAWGAGLIGELGDGASLTVPSPVLVLGPFHVTSLAAGGATGYATTRTGQVWVWGDGAMGQLGDGRFDPPGSGHQVLVPQRIPSLDHALRIFGGENETYALVG